MTTQKKIISVNGRNVSYLEAGEYNTRTIVLLHGNIGNAAFHWERLIPNLSHEYHIIAPDLPDYGESEALTNPTFAKMIQWLESFYNAREIHQGVVVGTSYGGLIARLFASQHPHEVPALVLINGGGLPSRATGFAKLLAQIPILNNFIFGRVSQQMLSSREAMNWLVEHPKTVKEDNLENHERLSAKGYIAPDPITEEMVTVAMNSATSLSRLMKTQVLSPVPDNRTPIIPTLILWGDEDEISTLKTGERIHNAIPGSEFIPISETKHAPHIEEPEVIAFQIERFLDNLSKPSAPDLPGVGELG